MNARSFGIEEEYLLLDARTGRPSNQAAALLSELSTFDGTIDREYFSSQVETATPVCTSAEEASAALEHFRGTVAQAAAARGVVLAGTGLPPIGGDTPGTVTPKPRYHAIEAAMREAATHQYATGMHVHVEIPSREVGVEVLARLARWAPTLLAMTANSPLWCGRPSGFASWRHISTLAWPVAGYPPVFCGSGEYERAVRHLVDSGVILDTGVITWLARLSEHYPTLELRIADVQLRAEDAVAYGVLVRALVDTCIADVAADRARARIMPGLVNGALWLAARDGLDSTLVDPQTTEVRPAFELVERLVDTAERSLTRHGDLARVEAYVARLREHGGPARRQLERFAERGMHGLLELYRDGTAARLRASAA